MSIELRIDTAALERLFPDGSAARVNLQQAVIQNFVDRHIKIKSSTDIPRMLAQFNEKIQDAIKTEFNRHISGSNWASIKPNDSTTALFKEAAARIYDAEIKKIMEEQETRFRGYLKRMIDESTTGLQSKFDAEMTRAVEFKVKQEMLAKLNK